MVAYRLYTRTMCIEKEDKEDRGHATPPSWQSASAPDKGPHPYTILMGMVWDQGYTVQAGTCPTVCETQYCAYFALVYILMHIGSV